MLRISSCAVLEDKEWTFLTLTLVFSCFFHNEFPCLYSYASKYKSQNNPIFILEKAEVFLKEHDS